MNLFIVAPLILAFLLIGLLSVGAIIGIATLGQKKRGGLTEPHRNHVNGVAA